MKRVITGNIKPNSALQTDNFKQTYHLMLVTSSMITDIYWDIKKYSNYKLLKHETQKQIQQTEQAKCQ